MTDPVDRLPQLSAPRALPAELRLRLEEALLEPVSRPRSLSPALRAQLQQDLRRRWRWQPVAAAVAAAAAAVVGVVLALPDHRATPPASTAGASPSVTALLGTGGPAGAGTAGGGSTGGGTTGGAASGTTSGGATRAPEPPASGAGPAVPAPVVVTAPRPSPPPSPAAAPTVLSISPSSGTPGTWVTLTGRALAGTTRVTFGGVASTGLRVVSATEVQARAPQHLPGPVDVVLTTPSGSSAPQRYLFV